MEGHQMGVEDIVAHLVARVSALEQARPAPLSPSERIAAAVAADFESGADLHMLMNAAQAAMLSKTLGVTPRRAMQQPRGAHGHFLPKAQQPEASGRGPGCRLCVNAYIKDPTREEILAHQTHNGLATE